MATAPQPPPIPKTTGINYTPVGSLEPYLLSRKFVDLQVGPLGSGKTLASLMKVPLLASLVTPSVHGVRQARCAIVRNTAAMLADATIPDWLRQFPDGTAGTWWRTEKRFELNYMGQDGIPVEVAVLFRGLDDAADVRRLLSLQLSFAFMDEFREIDRSVFEALQGRVGRYPDAMLVPHRPEWGVNVRGEPISGCVDELGRELGQVFGSTNPPDEGSYWEGILSEPPGNMDVFIQPSGLSPEADWRQYLPANYYENLMEGKSQEWIDIYIHNKSGRTLSGKPVWPGFRRDFHVAKSTTEVIRDPAYPLIIGVDAGLTPACTINQLHPGHRLITHAEITTRDSGALRMINEHLRPLLATPRFNGCPVIVITDPAAMKRAETDERSVVDIFIAAGYRTRPAFTNAIVGRVSAVDYFLARQVDQKAALLIDPSCVVLIAGLAGRYRYKINKIGETSVLPEKNQWSHVCEALQYAAVNASGGAVFGSKAQVAAKPVELASAAGWT